MMMVTPSLLVMDAIHGVCVYYIECAEMCDKINSSCSFCSAGVVGCTAAFCPPGILHNMLCMSKKTTVALVHLQ